MGIAWIDDNLVRWSKGMKLARLIRLAEEMPTPYVIHFRLTSVGRKSPELCHPFPISASAPIHTDGTATAALCHNGHWNDWEDHVMRHAIATCRVIPEGDWSDSRAAAWIAHRVGINFLRFVSGKFAVLTPKGVQLFGDGWALGDTIYYSNEWWKNDYSHNSSIGYQSGVNNNYPGASQTYNYHRRNWQPSSVKKIDPAQPDLPVVKHNSDSGNSGTTPEPVES